jgi:predicted ATPase/DNA-binding SARP family transcriptional activator
MRFGLLGPIAVWRDGDEVSLGAAKQRAVLALLLLRANETVPTSRLIDELWDERPPTQAVKTVQVYVSQLRKVLGEGVVETRTGGYLVCVEPGALDVDRFETLLERGRTFLGASAPAEASAVLREALALWRGPALSDLEHETFARDEIGRLEELRLVAVTTRIEADLALGRHADVVPELEVLTREHPLRERLRELLVLALYRGGRQADALEMVQATRTVLREELGLDPSEPLQQLERAILVHDPALDLPIAPHATPSAESESAPAELPPLPAALTPLVGRSTELAQISELLGRPGTRLVTLVGAGGVGKTRLAVAVAESMPPAAFVTLAPVQEPELVGSVIARTLGLTDEATLSDWLRPRELLLVLDNFEHLLDAATLVTELLVAAPNLRVLATSRSPLNLSGEHQYTVPPLPQEDAVELFRERAAAVEADVGHGADIEEICRRLDCLPLAIELAAARAKTFPPDVVLARFEQRLALLTGGPRDRPERQRTLRATLEWSYSLLDEDEQRAFARLAVFAGGCTAEAAERVCDASLETLESLAGKSLISARGERFRMLLTIREYARECLLASDDADSIVRRLAELLCDAAGAFASERGRGRAVPLSRLEAELENIRVAIRAALAWPDDPLALRLSVALSSFWRFSARHAEGLRWTVLALEQTKTVPASERAAGLQAAALFATLTGDTEKGRAFGAEALELYRAAGDELGAAEVLPWLADAHLQAGDPDRARILHAESLSLVERVDSPMHRARACRLAAEDELAMGDPIRANELYNRALEIARPAELEGEVVMTLHGLGDVCLVRGEAAAAVDFYVEALRSSVDDGSTAHCLAGLAAAAALEQRVELAGHTWGAVESHQLQLGEPLIFPLTKRRYEAAFAPIEGALFTNSVAAGRNRTLEEATRVALEIFGGQPATSPATNGCA